MLTISCGFLTHKQSEDAENIHCYYCKEAAENKPHIIDEFLSGRFQVAVCDYQLIHDAKICQIGLKLSMLGHCTRGQ